MMKVVRLVRCTDLLVNVTGCSARGLSGRTGVGGSGLSGGLAHRLWNKPNWGQLRGTGNCFAFLNFLVSAEVAVFICTVTITQKSPLGEFKANRS